MSTKNLARTIDVDGDRVFARRRKGYKASDDELGPARRWLERQVGRPWDLVRRELLTRFDATAPPFHRES